MSLPHHANARALYETSEKCHLCALIWTTLNREQQEILLRNVAANEGARIRIVVIDDVLVPHYGAFNRPQRWQPAVPGYRHWETEVGTQFAKPLFLLCPKRE